MAGPAAARGPGLPWERTLLVETSGDHWADAASVLAGARETIILRSGSQAGQVTGK
ncbi:hypothetical protein [Streptomyces sp. NRRL WC-3742]|uniref:hypothetical protein n=1 Tax=Streptomyces sp. NRRL WC-3742 TaxID=1463934 RepID=UPI000A4BB8A4|nr:hypothetical protein [Streptomyces sp. NRRL WC-3742]